MMKSVAITALPLFAVTAAQAAPIKTVFVIAMESHNWTQPSAALGFAAISGAFRRLENAVQVRG